MSKDDIFFKSLLQTLFYFVVGMEYDEEDKVDGFTGVPPQSNMVLRKRIKRIRAGMKKYNTQLDEVKR